MLSLPTFLLDSRFLFLVCTNSNVDQLRSHAEADTVWDRTRVTRLAAVREFQNQTQSTIDDQALF